MREVAIAVGLRSRLLRVAGASFCIAGVWQGCSVDNRQLATLALSPDAGGTPSRTHLNGRTGAELGAAELAPQCLPPACTADRGEAQDASTGATETNSCPEDTVCQTAACAQDEICTDDGANCVPEGFSADEACTRDAQRCAGSLFQRCNEARWVTI